MLLFRIGCCCSGLVGCCSSAPYDSSPSISLPELAIFMGRPLRLVKVVSRLISRDLQTDAIRSCEVYVSPTTCVPSGLAPRCH